MEQKKQKNKKKKKLVRQVVKYKYIKLAIIALVFFCVIGLIAWGIWCLNTNIKYSDYKEKLEWYKLDKLYENDKANSTQKVYKSEIAKLALGVVLNVTNEEFAVKQMQEIADATYTTNRAWLEFAKYCNMSGIDEQDFEKRASKIDAAKYLVQAIEKFLNQKIEITEIVDEKLLKYIAPEDTYYINKAISIGILKNKKSDITDKKLIKGEFNQMLVTVMDKYNTVFYNSLYNRNIAGVKLVTDKEKLPSNYEMYPYIVDNIDKEIYEITTDNMTSEISKTPLEVYHIYKDEYANTNIDIIEYFDYILNVDYRNINSEKLIDDINEYFVYDLELNLDEKEVYKDVIKEYVDYVISNEIILKGKATPLLPIIYSNGLLHFLRVKIELTVTNSKTNENLLLWDENTTYNSKNIEVYVDVPVSPTYYSKAFRIVNGNRLMEYVIKTDGNVEVK